MNLSLNYIFKIKKITENEGKNFIFDIISDKNLRKNEISFGIKLIIENFNINKEKISDFFTYWRHSVGSFKHSDVLKQPDLKINRKN